MKTSSTFNIISQLALAGALTAIVGCASSNYERGAATSASITDAANKIDAGKVKIDATLTSLNDLVNTSQGDLAPKYKQFSAAVNNLQSAAKDVKDRVADMREKGSEYFKAWDEQLAQIKNEDIKNRSAERKQTVQKEFTDIKKSYTEVQMAFEPFMSNLRDIQTALGNDLTMQGIASIKGAAEQADKHGAELNASVDKLAAEFRDLGVAMSTSAPTNAPPQ
jgi:ABC-type transporter Mla subunit MlaD